MKRGLESQGCNFHNIASRYMIQGGDIIHGHGTGGEPIYGATFKDENFIIKHDKRFLLSMMNSGPDTNGSQFLITLAPTPYMDRSHVVFGEVIGGKDVIDVMECCGGESGDVSKVVSIVDCGEVL